MNSQLASAIRTLAVLLGSYFIGKNFLGLPIDSVLWGKIVGVVLVIGGVAWSFLDKKLTQEIWQAAARHVITFAGGILLAKGILTDQMWQAIIGVLGAIAPWIQSAASISLNKRIKADPTLIDNLRS